LLLWIASRLLLRISSGLLLLRIGTGLLLRVRARLLLLLIAASRLLLITRRLPITLLLRVSAGVRRGRIVFLLASRGEQHSTDSETDSCEKRISHELTPISCFDGSTGEDYSVNIFLIRTDVGPACGIYRVRPVDLKAT
jgi:hypothetical protein